MKYTRVKIEMAWMLANNVLTRFRYPGKEGWNLFRFRRAAEPVASFLQEERKKLQEDCGAEPMQGGLVKFRCEEDRDRYVRGRDELEKAEEEMEMCPLRLRLPQGIELMEGDWEIMDGIIELYDPEDDEIRIGDVRILPEGEAPEGAAPAGEKE